MKRDEELAKKKREEELALMASAERATPTLPPLTGTPSAA
jgi:hypothetical protein